MDHYTYKLLLQNQWKRFNSCKDASGTPRDSGAWGSGPAPSIKRGAESGVDTPPGKAKKRAPANDLVDPRLVSNCVDDSSSSPEKAERLKQFAIDMFIEAKDEEMLWYPAHINVRVKDPLLQSIR